jgi:hypothetical protein
MHGTFTLTGVDNNATSALSLGHPDNRAGNFRGTININNPIYTEERNEEPAYRR